MIPSIAIHAAHRAGQLAAAPHAVVAITPTDATRSTTVDGG